MKQVAQVLIDWTAKGQSRRGFLATCGKLTLGLGAAMMGLSATPQLVAAANCCTGTSCGAGCPTPPNPAGPCPSGCMLTGSSQCCDRGGTDTFHVCAQCNCGSPCVCEYDTGNIC